MGDDEVLQGELCDELVRAMQKVPELHGRELVLRALSGGITNRNFLVEATGGAGRYVIRLAGNDTHLLGISREVEHAATIAAAGVGVGPEVVQFIRPEGYLVTRFIEGSPIPPDVVRRPANLARAADALRRIHDGPAIPGLFIPLRIVEAYRALALERGVAIPPAYAVAAAAGRRIERALLSNPVEIRPCHNDLLNANLIDDGARIRIVDWEYAGMGDPFFDLGNFSVNHELTPDEDAELLRGYEGQVRRPASPGSRSCASSPTSGKRCGASSSRASARSRSTSARTPGSTSSASSAGPRRPRSSAPFARRRAAPGPPDGVRPMPLRRAGYPVAIGRPRSGAQ